jgi:dTDP-4-dehydrorhamnose reductase
MKLVCEEIIRERFERHFIFRCPIIHSTGEESSNSFIDSAIMKLAGQQQINAYTNVIRHYVLVDELVDFLISIAGSDHYGTFNIGSEPASYYDRIFSIALKNNLNTDSLSKDTGIVSPQVQLFDLTKFNNIFKKIFN